MEIEYHFSIIECNHKIKIMKTNSALNPFPLQDILFTVGPEEISRWGGELGVAI